MTEENKPNKKVDETMPNVWKWKSTMGNGFTLMLYGSYFILIGIFKVSAHLGRIMMAWQKKKEKETAKEMKIKLK